MGPKKRAREMQQEQAVVLPRRADGSFDVDEARRLYDTNGFVALQLLDEPQREAGIYELYERVLMTQPWNDPAYTSPRDVAPLVLRDEHGPIRAPAAGAAGSAALAEHKRRVVRALRSADLDRSVLDDLKEHWPLHVSFGAPCDDAGFHLPLVWGVRQDPHVYAVVRALSGTDELWVDINRPIMKLPEQGEQEFLHWDLDVLKKPFVARSPNVQGKVVYTPSRFVAVAQTHTPAFQARFVRDYAKYFPNTTKPVAKTGLAPEKDPHGYFDQQREYLLPGGSCIFWNAQLLHGQTKTPRDESTEFGFYLGFFPAGARPEYAAALGKLDEESDDDPGGPADELEDRLRSFNTGRAPKLWPSFDRIHFYPALWQCYTGNVTRTIAKLPPGHLSISSRKSKTKPGVVYPHLLPWRPPNYDEEYSPPALTLLGRRLLGSAAWPEPGAGSSAAGSSALYTPDGAPAGTSRDDAIPCDSDSDCD